MRILAVVCGNYGLGKGTLCKGAVELLSQIGVPSKHVSSGDLLRGLGGKYIKEMKGRALVEDKGVVLSLVRKEIPRNGHVLLDGFPRNNNQVDETIQIAKEEGFEIRLIWLWAENAVELAEARLAERAKTEEGQERPENTEDSFQNGLEVYNKETEPSLYRLVQLVTQTPCYIDANWSKKEIAETAVHYILKESRGIRRATRQQEPTFPFAWYNHYRTPNQQLTAKQDDSDQTQ